MCCRLLSNPRRAPSASPRKTAAWGGRARRKADREGDCLAFPRARTREPQAVPEAAFLLLLPLILWGFPLSRPLCQEPLKKRATEDSCCYYYSASNSTLYMQIRPKSNTQTRHLGKEVQPEKSEHCYPPRAQEHVGSKARVLSSAHRTTVFKYS